MMVQWTRRSSSRRYHWRILRAVTDRLASGTLWQESVGIVRVRPARLPLMMVVAMNGRGQQPALRAAITRPNHRLLTVPNLLLCSLYE